MGEIAVKEEIWRELDAVLASANWDARAAAFRKREERYEEVGLHLNTVAYVEQGREPLAERLVATLNEGSRVDAILVGSGLLCGLAASVCGTWLPSN